MPLIPVELKILDEVVGVPLSLGDAPFEVSAFKVSSAAGISECLALCVGQVTAGPDTPPCLVRLQSGCVTGEVFASTACDCKWQLEDALHRIRAEGRGVLVYLPEHEGRAAGLVAKLRSLAFMAVGISTFEAFARLGLPRDCRDYQPAAVALKRLGVQRVRLITNNPEKVDALQREGIDVCESIPSVMETGDPQLRAYLASKGLATPSGY